MNNDKRFFKQAIKAEFSSRASVAESFAIARAAIGYRPDLSCKIRTEFENQLAHIGFCQHKINFFDGCTKCRRSGQPLLNPYFRVFMQRMIREQGLDATLAFINEVRCQ